MHAARRVDDAVGLSLAELEEIARESGLDPGFVRQAAQEFDEPAHDLFSSSSGSTSTHVIIERWVPGRLTMDLWEDIVAELRHRFDSDLGSAMGMPGYGIGTTEQIGRTVEWRHTNLFGVSTRLMMRERGDGIMMRFNRRVGLGSEMTEGLAYGSILAFFAGLIGLAVASSLIIGLMVFFLALAAIAPLIMVADRRWRKKQQRQLNGLADRVARIAAEHTQAAQLAEPSGRDTAAMEGDSAHARTADLEDAQERQHGTGAPRDPRRLDLDAIDDEDSPDNPTLDARRGMNRMR